VAELEGEALQHGTVDLAARGLQIQPEEAAASAVALAGPRAGLELRQSRQPLAAWRHRLRLLDHLTVGGSPVPNVVVESLAHPLQSAGSHHQELGVREPRNGIELHDEASIEQLSRERRAFSPGHEDLPRSRAENSLAGRGARAHGGELGVVTGSDHGDASWQPEFRRRGGGQSADDLARLDPAWEQVRGDVGMGEQLWRPGPTGQVDSHGGPGRRGVDRDLACQPMGDEAWHHHEGLRPVERAGDIVAQPNELQQGIERQHLVPRHPVGLIRIVDAGEGRGQVLSAATLP